MNDLRSVALQRAAEDCRPEPFGQDTAQAVVARAEVYLAFLLGQKPAPITKKKAKR